jgi:hypothetical protein
MAQKADLLTTFSTQVPRCWLHSLTSDVQASAAMETYIPCLLVSFQASLLLSCLLVSLSSMFWLLLPCLALEASAVLQIFGDMEHSCSSCIFGRETPRMPLQPSVASMLLRWSKVILHDLQAHPVHTLLALTLHLLLVDPSPQN